MSQPPTRVIKLGGSLLDWPQLATRFQSWLRMQSPARNLLVVGGGGMVDTLRAWDDVQAISPEAMHWLAIKAMTVTAAMAAELFAAKVVSTLPIPTHERGEALEILDVEPFLREDDGRPGSLPHCWHVTSDSIAARAAQLIGDCDLVLIKSTLPPGEPTADAWAACGFVDAYFAHAAKGLQTRAVNLRSRGFAEMITLPTDCHAATGAGSPGRIG